MAQFMSHGKISAAVTFEGARQNRTSAAYPVRKQHAFQPVKRAQSDLPDSEPLSNPDDGDAASNRSQLIMHRFSKCTRMMNVAKRYSVKIQRFRMPQAASVAWSQSFALRFLGLASKVLQTHGSSCPPEDLSDSARRSL